MSNSISHNILHQSLLRPTVLEHQSKLNSFPTNTLSQATLVNQGSNQHQKSALSTKFLGNNLSIGKPKMAMRRRRLAVFLNAALATDSASKLARKFNLDGNIELQVNVSAPTSGSITQINIEVTNSSGSLILHWGGIREGQDTWVLPSRHPEGTSVYKNRALRSPFVKSSSNSILRIEIDDPAIQAIEFLILDESQNRWYKYNGENFHVKLPPKEKLISNIALPEDLVQVQAYLRWERKGKQMYTPQQEKA